MVLKTDGVGFLEYCTRSGGLCSGSYRLLASGFVSKKFSFVILKNPVEVAHPSFQSIHHFREQHGVAPRRRPGWVSPPGVQEISSRRLKMHVSRKWNFVLFSGPRPQHGVILPHMPGFRRCLRKNCPWNPLETRHHASEIQ